MGSRLRDYGNPSPATFDDDEVAVLRRSWLLWFSSFCWFAVLVGLIASYFCANDSLGVLFTWNGNKAR